MRHQRIVRRQCAVPALLILLLAAAAGAALAAQAPAQPQAATRASGLDEILKAVASYDGGLESGALWKLRDYVYARKDDAAGRAECETKLLAFLKTPGATPVAKMAAARLLRVIASDQAVPALQAMLLDDRVSDTALYALQQIPGPAADKALLQALPKAAGPIKIELIAALGQRRTVDAVPALVPLLKQPAFARAATLALGAIGGHDATGALVAAYPAAGAEVKSVTASAILECAEKQLAAKNAADATRLYQAVAADASLPVSLRRAAAIGRISAAGSGGTALVAEYVGGSDPVLHDAAFARFADTVRPEGVAPIAALLPRLPEASQVRLLAALAGYPRERVLPAVREAAGSAALPVRLAALKALESVGDVSALPALLDQAARTRGAEQAAARAAIGLLKGRAVDDAILARLSEKPGDEVTQELLLAVAERRIFAAKPAVAALLAATTPATRSAAHRALRVIGTPSDIPAVLDRLVKTDDETERAAAEETVSSLARKMTNADARAGMVTTVLAREKTPEVRARLIAVLPLLGDNSTLPLLRQALADSDSTVSDAAFRALTAWPTSAARDDVFRLARDSRDETRRLLAITGFIRIVRLDRFREPEAAVADLAQAAAFSWRPEERRLVLGALSQFPCGAALDLATSFLQDPALKAEAEAAVSRIKQRLAAPGRSGT
jgi:HEAT repeat protein